MKTVAYAFSCEKVCRSHREDGRELWTLTVRAKNLPTTFKYGPNARFATLTNKPAKEMLDTLRGDPASFVFKNNGMMLVAGTIRASGDHVELVCQEAEQDDTLPGHGVLNGGHTYRCLTEALANPQKYVEAAEKAVVTITVAIGIVDDVWRISKARNTSEKVPLHALRELAGDWSALKAYLPKQTQLLGLVAFKPNELGAEAAEFDPTDLVRRIALMNNRMFPAEKGQHPVNAYLSVGSLVRTYKQEDFLDLAPLLPDVLRLEELVVREWESANGHRKKADKLGVISNVSGCSGEAIRLLSGYKASLTLADPFVLPVMAAFRVFVKDGQWVRPLDDLWRDYGRRTIEALWDAYNESGRSSAAYFGRSKASWMAACDLTKGVALQNGWITVT
jgi:hypothetical protein